MHPDVDGGHSAEASFLTAAAHPGRPSFRNTVSLDQLAAEQMGHSTRFASLTLSATHVASMSYSRSGVRIPPDTNPAKIFAKLFIDGTPKEKEIQVERMRDGRSVMDLVLSEVKQVERKIGREDMDTLSQYITSVRELEMHLAEGEEWVSKPKPEVDFKAPAAELGRAGFTAKMRMIYDLMFLALSTDSTRLITFMGSRGNDVLALDGVAEGRHNLSHHGLDPQKIEQLAIIELEEMALFSEFLGKMKTLKEKGVPLLDQTAIILGSGIGNASSHSNLDLPVLLAGGNFKHGQHLAFDGKKAPPLANLFFSCLQHLGMESDRFATGTGTLNGI